MKHESPTPSQLDIIAEVNARAARQGSGRRALAFAFACGVILAGAAAWWWLPRTLPPAQQAAPTAAPAAPAEPAVAAATVQTSDPPIEAAASAPAAEASPPPASSPSAEADSRARKWRARREAELRASAIQAQQERLRAETQPRLEAAAEPPQTPPQARDVAVAATRGAAESLPEPRRSVDVLCQASGNFVSRLLCQSRECRKADNANDAHCVRLREIEEARQRRDPP